MLEVQGSCSAATVSPNSGVRSRRESDEPTSISQWPFLQCSTREATTWELNVNATELSDVN